MGSVPSFPDQSRHRKAQLAAGGAVALLALVLVGWLLLRPDPAVPDSGTTPRAGSTRVSAAQTPSASPAATGEPSTATSAPSTRAAQPALVVAPPTTATAGPLASVPGGAQVLFVGDGIDPSGAANDWSALTASTLGLAGTPVQRSVAAADGAGWASRSADGRTFTDLVSAVATPQTRVVVLLGSRNDLSAPGDVAAGAARTLETVRAVAPEAQAVVVAPPPLGDDGAPALLQQRRELTAAAATTGALFLDPSTSGWAYQPTWTTDADGSVRLTSDGQVQLAQVVLPVVQRLLSAPQ